MGVKRKGRDTVLLINAGKNVEGRSFFSAPQEHGPPANFFWLIGSITALSTFLREARSLWVFSRAWRDETDGRKFTIDRCLHLFLIGEGDIYQDALTRPC